jgi:hypothetical protein
MLPVPRNVRAPTESAPTWSGYSFYHEQEVSDREFIEKAQQLGFSWLQSKDDSPDLWVKAANV